MNLYPAGVYCIVDASVHTESTIVDQRHNIIGRNAAIVEIRRVYHKAATAVGGKNYPRQRLERRILCRDVGKSDMARRLGHAICHGSLEPPVAQPRNHVGAGSRPAYEQRANIGRV